LAPSLNSAVCYLPLLLCVGSGHNYSHQTGGSMKKPFVVLVALALLVPGAWPVRAQGIRAAEPFKLGTFTNNGQQFLGIVLRDRFVVELDASNREFESRPD